MVKGYLMGTKNIFNKIKERFASNEDNLNYQIYIPERGCLIGYFFDINLEPTEIKFCDENLTDRKKSKLEGKISKGRFVKELSLDDSALNGFFIFSQKSLGSRAGFEKCFKNFEEYYIQD